MSSRWRRRTVVKRHGNAVTPRLYRLPAQGRHLLILLRREGNTTPRGDWIATPQIHWPTFNTSVHTYYHIKYRLPEIHNQRLALRILHEYAVLLMMSSSKYCFIWRWNYCKINPLPPRLQRLSSAGSTVGETVESEDEARRASHNVLERKRRNDLKSSFQVSYPVFLLPLSFLPPCYLSVKEVCHGGLSSPSRRCISLSLIWCTFRPSLWLCP